jgi:hypothetical protein
MPNEEDNLDESLQTTNMEDELSIRHFTEFYNVSLDNRLQIAPWDSEQEMYNGDLEHIYSNFAEPQLDSEIARLNVNEVGVRTFGRIQTNPSAQTPRINGSVSPENLAVELDDEMETYLEARIAQAHRSQSSIPHRSGVPSTHISSLRNNASSQQQRSILNPNDTTELGLFRRIMTTSEQISEADTIITTQHMESMAEEDEIELQAQYSLEMYRLHQARMQLLEAQNNLLDFARRTASQSLDYHQSNHVRVNEYPDLEGADEDDEDGEEEDDDHHHFRFDSAHISFEDHHIPTSSIARPITPSSPTSPGFSLWHSSRPAHENCELDGNGNPRAAEPQVIRDEQYVEELFEGVGEQADDAREESNFRTLLRQWERELQIDAESEEDDDNDVDEVDDDDDELNATPYRLPFQRVCPVWNSDEAKRKKSYETFQKDLGDCIGR